MGLNVVFLILIILVSNFVHRQITNDQQILLLISRNEVKILIRNVENFKTSHLENYNFILEEQKDRNRYKSGDNQLSEEEDPYDANKIGNEIKTKNDQIFKENKIEKVDLKESENSLSKNKNDILGKLSPKKKFLMKGVKNIVEKSQVKKKQKKLYEKAQVIDSISLKQDQQDNQNYEESEEQYLQNRIDSFLVQKSVFNIKLSIITKVLFLIPQIIYTFIVVYLININNKNMIHAVQNTGEIVHASTNGQFIFMLLQEYIGTMQLDKYAIEDGTPLFDDYFQLAYANLKYISTHQLVITGSQSEKKLNDQIYKLFHQNVCINYLSLAENYKCDQELLNAGLETVTIQILEKSRDLLSTFRKSSQDKNEASKIMNSQEFKLVGKIFNLFSKIN